MKLALAAVGVLAVLAQDRARAQAPRTALLGAWERFALIEPDGTPIANPPPSFLIFSPDGYYSVTAMYSGRARITTDLQAMTKEELLARFGSVVARRGRYTIRGDTLTRHIAAHSDPTLEGGADTEQYRIDADILVLRGAGQREARYRRPR